MNFWQNSSKTLHLAWPLFIGMASTQALEMIDLMMIGQLGLIELGAASFASGIIGFIYLVLHGYASSISIAVASRLKHSHRVLVPAFLNMLLISMLFIGVMELVRINLDWFGQSQHIIPHAKSYLFYVQWSLLPVGIFLVFKQFSDGHGKSLTPTLIMLTSLLVNLGLNWLLIYGNWGFPKLGIDGAGIATLISRCCLLFHGILFFWRDLLAIDIKNDLFGSPAIHQDIYKIGMTTSIQYSFEIGVFSFATIMAGWIGISALAAHQIALKICSITFMIPLSIGIAAGIRISTVDSEKRIAEKSPLVFHTQLLCLALMFLTACFLIAFGRQLGHFFTDHIETINLAAALFLIAALFQLADGLQAVQASLLRGLRDLQVPIFITFFCYWLVAAPLGYLLTFTLQLGPQGIWIGLSAGLGSAALLLYLRLRKLKDINPASWTP